MCDLLLKTIYDEYKEYASDLFIGYSFSGKRNRKLKNLLHVYHLASESKLSESDALRILNYYEY